MKASEENTEKIQENLGFLYLKYFEIFRKYRSKLPDSIIFGIFIVIQCFVDTSPEYYSDLQQTGHAGYIIYWQHIIQHLKYKYLDYITHYIFK